MFIHFKSFRRCTFPSSSSVRCVPVVIESNSGEAYVFALPRVTYNAKISVFVAEKKTSKSIYEVSVESEDGRLQRHNDSESDVYGQYAHALSK